MTVRETSLETYRKIQENGLLSAQRLTVYGALYRAGPCTARELARWMRVHGIGQPDNRYMCSRRLPELRDRGVVREAGTRVCSTHTGSDTPNPMIVWQTTDSLPSRPIEQGRETRKDLQNKIRELREQNEIQRRQIQSLREQLAAYKRQGSLF